MNRVAPNGGGTTLFYPEQGPQTRRSQDADAWAFSMRRYSSDYFRSIHNLAATGGGKRRIDGTSQYSSGLRGPTGVSRKTIGQSEITQTEGRGQTEVRLRAT